MTDPLFWLVLSFLFVTISLTIVLVVAIPAFRELGRAARSAEKLFDTLQREFPPTLEAIRLTGLEITDLTEDMSEGVQSAGQVVKQVDESLGGVRKQAQKVQSGTRSLMVGMKVAWKAFTRPGKSQSARRSPDRLPPARSEGDPTLGTRSTRRLPAEDELDSEEYSENYTESYSESYSETYSEPFVPPQHNLESYVEEPTGHADTHHTLNNRSRISPLPAPDRASERGDRTIQDQSEPESKQSPR